MLFRSLLTTSHSDTAYATSPAFADVADHLETFTAAHVEPAPAFHVDHAAISSLAAVDLHSEISSHSSMWLHV